MVLDALERAESGGGRVGEGLEVVSTLEEHQATARRHGADNGRSDVGVVAGAEGEPGQRIAAVGVEAGGDDAATSARSP